MFPTTTHLRSQGRLLHQLHNLLVQCFHLDWPYLLLVRHVQWDLPQLLLRTEFSYHWYPGSDMCMERNDSSRFTVQLWHGNPDMKEKQSRDKSVARMHVLEWFSSYPIVQTKVKPYSWLS